MTDETTPKPTKRAASPKSAEPPSPWALLAAPFPQDQVEKLPKPLKRQDDNRGRCEQGTYYSADGHYCGGWHARSVHLDYVGHAGITTRLNEVVGPEGWTLEPMAVDSDGLPIMGQGQGGVFWVRLTILGVSKIDVAANYSSVQEALGDGLRRAAMRFGVGTYLWSKSDAAKAQAEFSEAPPEPQAPPGWKDPANADLLEELNALDEPTANAVRAEWPYPGRGPSDLTADEVAAVRHLVDAKVAAARDPWATQTPSGATEGQGDPS